MAVRLEMSYVGNVKLNARQGMLNLRVVKLI